MHLSRTSNQLSNERNSGPPAVVELNPDPDMTSATGWIITSDAWVFGVGGLLGNFSQGVCRRETAETISQGMTVTYDIDIVNPNGSTVTFSMGGTLLLTTTGEGNFTDEVILGPVGTQLFLVSNADGDGDQLVVQRYSVTVPA